MEKLTPIKSNNPAIIQTLTHTKRNISKDFLQPIRRAGKTFCAWCNERELPTGKRKYCSDGCSAWSSAFCNPQTSELAFKLYMERQDFRCAGCNHDYNQDIMIARESNMAWYRKRAFNEIKTIKRTIPELIARQRKRIGTYDPAKDVAVKEVTPEGYLRITPAEGDPIANIKSLKGWQVETRKQFQQTYDSYRKTKSSSKNYWTWNIRDIINNKHRNNGTGLETEVDHIIPVALGGTTLGFENFQVLCHNCHKIKTAKDMIEIREYKKSNKKLE